MYAKVHKNGNITVYRDYLDCDYSKFDCQGIDAITNFEELWHNIYYLDELNTIDAQMLDGYGVYIVSCNEYNGSCGVCYYVSPEELATYTRRGQLHLYAIDLSTVFDDAELYEILS